jgi:fermentation-respiration switch protein FrsA (DUF1100 family)
MKRLWPLLLVLLGGVVLKALVGSLESRLVFFPYKGEDATPASLGIRYNTVELVASDGERLAAWQLEPDNPKADIVYFHGNGGNLSVWLPVLAALHRLDYRVFALDYRGYGRSTGSPTEEGMYRDAEAAARFVAGRRTPGRPLVFWGRSLGGAAAAFAARGTPPDGLVLESAFPSKAAVIRNQPILRALNIVGRYRFDTVELLRGFRQPVLVMHGDRDRIIPFALGRELYERLTGPRQFVAIPGADHNDFFDPANRAYWEPVSRFIDALR